MPSVATAKPWPMPLAGGNVASRARTC
jgi:hypothetical protein